MAKLKNILSQIIQAKEEVRVIVVNDDLAACQTELTNFGVDWQSGNVEFLQAPSNSVWIRDYGANPIYLNGVDSLALVDWIYNRPRPLDDVVPDAVGGYFGLPVYSTTEAPYDLAHPGRNNFSDGMGTNFSSKLVLLENGFSNQWGTSNHTEEGVDSIMERFYGIDRYVKFDPLPYDGIHHIDMHMKLLNETTLLVGEYPEGVPDGCKFKQTSNTCWTISQRLSVRLTGSSEYRCRPKMGCTPAWERRCALTSSLLHRQQNCAVADLRGAVRHDGAPRIWREAMPGYRIVGINCNGIIDAGGAIHCIVKEVGVQDPLLIQHRPLGDITGTNPPAYQVDAWVRHRSGVAGATLYFTTDTTAAWQSLGMALENADSNRWSAAIPHQPECSTVYYYIHASANSGKQVVRPLVAPEGWFRFRIHPTTAVQETVAASAQLGNIYPNPASTLTCVPVQSEGGAKPPSKSTTCWGGGWKRYFRGGFRRVFPGMISMRGSSRRASIW